MHKCIMFKIRGSKKRKLGKTRKLSKNKGKFLNFVEIWGKFINFVEIGLNFPYA